MSRLLPFLLVGLVACGNTDTKLKVTGIEPDKGDAGGGTYVRIFGNGFVTPNARSAKIYFGDRQAATPRFASDTEMIVEAPGGKPNASVDVLVIFEPGGELKLPHAFTFVEKEQRQMNVNDLDTSKAK
ncbi:MAG: IPT/TIG domain-containing protein [Acidobacteriota bacterium]